MKTPFTHTQHPESTQKSLIAASLTAGGILLFLAAWCMAGTPSDSYSVLNRTWGFDHILFYGLTGRLLFLAGGLFILIPYTNRWAVKGLSRLADGLLQLRKRKHLLFLLVSVISMVLFYLLTVKYYFLGDFNLRLIQTMKKEFVATEYLTMRLLYAFTSFGARFGYSHDQLFRLYSYLMGGGFVFISLLIADLTGRTGLQKLLFFLTQTGTALILVFCGYVEVYATPVMLLQLYLYLGLRYLYTRSGFLYAALSLALAIACHLLCLAALPSLVLAWYFHNRNKVPFISGWSNQKTAVWIAGLILLVVFLAFKTKSGFLHALSKPAGPVNTLTLFDYRHFWEFFNGLVLSGGLSVFFIFILLLKSIREKKALKDTHYFLLSIHGCFFLLIFVANLQRGSGDWDIMAFSAIGLNLVTLMLITHLYEARPALTHHLMMILVGLNGLHTFLWLQINHTDRSIRKIETMLVNDPGTYYTARISGIIQLALTYKNNNLLKEAQNTAYKACNLRQQPDIRPCVMYGMSLKEEKRTEEALVFFEELLSRSAIAYEAYLFVLEYYEKSQNNEKFLYYLNLLFDAFLRKPNAFTTNVNFKPQLVSRLFEVLYKYTPPGDTERLKQIASISAALKNYQPPSKK